MSDETQVAEATQEQDSLVNFTPAQEETTEEQPMSVFEQDPNEDAPIENDDEPFERPDYYPEKFWDENGPDVEKLAKSYAELEKAFKQGKHKAPEDGYNVDDLVDRGLDLEDPSVQVYQEWAQKYGISQKAFEELAGGILELAGEQDEMVAYDRQEEMNKLGERAQEKIEYLERHIKRASLNGAEQQALAAGLTSADSINAMVKFIQGYTNEAIPTSPVVATPEMNVDDLRQAIADPRWQSDPVWRSRIEKQWEAANG
jgi:hypothetical protein